jgi:hypothetical protein
MISDVTFAHLLPIDESIWGNDGMIITDKGLPKKSEKDHVPMQFFPSKFHIDSPRTLLEPPRRGVTHGSKVNNKSIFSPHLFS